MSTATAGGRTGRHIPAQVTPMNPVPTAAPGFPAVGTGSTPALAPVTRLYRSPVPRHEPRAASRVRIREDRSALPATQGTLALAIEVPGPDGEPAGTPGTGPRAAGWLGTAEPGSASSGLLPEPGAWAATFVQAAMEVAGGLRSPAQLLRWTTPEVHATLVRRGALTARARRTGPGFGAKPRVRALLTCTPRPGVCEVAAVIAEPDRVRAVAFRMEGQHGRWRVTELEIG